MGDRVRIRSNDAAYEVLSNHEKRKQYDLGIDPNDQNGGGFQGGGTHMNFDPFEMFKVRPKATNTRL